MALSKDDILNAVADMSVMDIVSLIEAMEEKNCSGAAIGQTGSSTRQELTAWILVLSLPM